ncbi:MAG: efflux RND transporter periplasmic adaptor subunit [Gemmatimonadota bacterium]
MREWGLVVMAATATAACGSAEADSADDMAASEGYVRVINVEVVPLQAQDFVEDIRLTSVAMANQDIMVAAQEGGVIREFFVDRGDRVDEGQPIAKIDDSVLSAQVDQARASADLASQTWDRRRRLWEEDRVGSEIAYLEARYASEQAAASLEGLEEHLARTVIRAPFAGIFDQRNVDVGAMVSPGQAVGRLVDLDPIKVFAGVPERYAPDVHVGDEAILAFDALGNEAYTAIVRYVGSTVDPQNRTFPIEVELPNRNGLIKPQMVANMAVTRRSVSNVVVVPQDALVRVEDGYVVFVATERDGVQVAEVRPVTLGPTRRNRVVIEQGVEPGEQLIVVGNRSVADGDRINVVDGGS